MLLKGCTGKEKSTDHELIFLGKSAFMRKKAGVWRNLLRLIGTVGLRSKPCHLELKWMSGNMLVKSPLSLHIQGDVSRSIGQSVVIKLT